MADIPIADSFEVKEDWSKIDQSNQIKEADSFKPFQLSDAQKQVLQKNQQMVQTAVPAVMQEAAFGQKQRRPRKGSNWDVIKSQFGQSTLGLLGDRAASIGQEGPYKYKPEDVVEPEGFLQEALGMGAQVLGDIPSYIVYGAPGLLAGPAGGKFASPTLAMGGTEFTKSLLRQEDMPTALKHGGKGALTGAAMGAMGAMGLPAKYVPSIRPAMKKLALPMEIAGGAAVSSGLEGKPLELKDIALMAIPVAGIHTATKTTSAAANLISRRRRNALAESKLAQAEAMPADTPEQQTKKLEAIKGAEALRSQAFEKKSYEAGARPFEPTEEELQRKREAEEEKGTVKISEEDTAGKRRRKKVGEAGDFEGLPFGEMISDQMKSEREALKKKVREDAAAERRRLKEERIALKQAEKEKKAAVEKQAMVPEKVIEETQRQAQQIVDNATGRPVQEQVERLSRRKRQQQEREESARLRDAYEQHLDTLDLTPEGKAESLKDFDNLKHEGGINAQRDRISSIYTPDPAVAPTAEQIAAAQAVKAKVESDHLESNRAKRIADIQLLKDNGWDEAQIAEMDEKSLTAALRKVRNYRTDLLSKTPEEVDRMLDYEMSVAEMYDRIGSENPPSDMEMVEILKMAQALDITPINDVAQEAIRRHGQEENPLSYAEINKKRRDLIAESAQRMMAQKAAAEAAIPKTEPIAKTVIRRRAGQEQRLDAEQKIAQRRRGQTEQEPVSAKEEALRKLIEEQEADRLAQEEGRAFGDESIEDLRFREEERERQGYGPYDWEDRSVALSTHGDVVDWLSRSKVGEFVEGLKFSLDGLKEVDFKAYQAEARSVVNTFMQNLRKGIMPSLYDKQMALIRVYRIIPRGEREMAMWKDAIDTIESFSGEIPKGADQFSLRSIAEAYKDGLLTADEARHLNQLMGRLRERPTFKLEIETLKRKENKDLHRINIGTYNFITNTLKAKTPSAVAHEISHWAWFNVLNSADRKAFVADFQRRFYDEKSVPNFYRMAVETSNPIDAVKGPSEMFATRCQDYASDVVMTPTERGLFQKVRDWWNRLFHTADLVYKEGTFEGVTELFDKVWDKGHKVVWTDEGKPIIEGIDGGVSDAFMDEMTLWHGSSRIFSGFLDRFIGSGEGAQMRGWGHYFTSARAVGEWYANRVGRAGEPSFTYKGIPLDYVGKIALGKVGLFLNKNVRNKEDLRYNIAAEIDMNEKHVISQDRYALLGKRLIQPIDQSLNPNGLVDYGSIITPESLKYLDSITRAVETDKGTFYTPSFIDETIRTTNELKNADKIIDDIEIIPGKSTRILHEVEIPNDLNLLDLDKPITEKQVEAIKEGLTEFLKENLNNALKSKVYDANKFNTVDNWFNNIRFHDKVKYKESLFYDKISYEDIVSPFDRHILVQKGDRISESKVETLKDQGIERIAVLDNGRVEYISESTWNIDPIGEVAQQHLQYLFGKREASEFLRDRAGIHGNTYIGAESNKRNYVIFDEKIPQIKNSITLDMLGLQQVYEKLYDFVRGKMTDDQVRSKPTFADGDLRRLGDVVDEMTAGPIPDKTDAGVRKEALAETVGLSSMRDRMRAVYRDARLLYKVKNEGDKVVGEVKGADNDAVNIKLLRDDRDASKTSLIKQWTMLPRSVFGGTKAEPYWFRLNARDLYYQFMHDQDKIQLNNIWRSLGNNEKRINAIRQVIEGKNKNPDPQLLEASMQVKEWLDKKKAKIRMFLLDEYKRELNVTEYNALMDMIAGRDSMDVKAKYGNKINFNVIDDLWKKYKKIQKWGIDDYIPNYEFGRVKIIIKETTEKGKEKRHLIAIGLNEYDAVRKIQKHMEETGYKGTYYVDTGASDLFTKPVGISRNQYLGMLGRFQNEMAKSIKNINEELAKGIGKTKMREIGRRSIKAAKLYVEPSDKWSPYFEPRRDVLKGEEDLRHLLNHYSYSIEKKMALDPVIDDIRTAIKDKVFTDNQAQAFIDIINDVKGSTYWFVDRLTDSLLHNASSWATKPFKVDFDYRPYASLSSKLATGRKLEANLKLGYRAVAAFVNLSSGQIHAITKAGHKYWWDALNFIKTDEGKRFLEQVEPYLGTTLVEKAGQLKSKVPWWKPLGLFQMPEPFNRSVSAAARYLMSREKMGEKAAVEDAIRATWYEQFTYNLASLPRMMREPMGKTVLQFFPYVLNELSFIRSLKPAEWARYASYQFALGGFRGLVMTMKSLPILIGCGWWQEIMDYLDDVGNSIANNVLGGAAYRGMFGAAAALFGETGARAIPEVSGAASISLTPRIGFGGPLFQDIFTLIKTVSSGMPFSFTEKTEEAPYRRLTELRTTPATNEYRKGFERIVAAAAHWNKIWDYWVDQNHHVLDRKLQAIDQVPDLPAPEAVALMADSAMGAESIYHSSMKTARAISDRELERENRRKVGVTQKGVYDFIRGEGLQPDTLNRMMELEMGTDGIERGIEMQSIPLQQRRMPGESWRLYRRRTERFPTYEEEEQR